MMCFHVDLGGTTSTKKDRFCRPVVNAKVRLGKIHGTVMLEFKQDV